MNAFMSDGHYLHSCLTVTIACVNSSTGTEAGFLVAGAQECCQCWLDSEEADWG